MLDLQIDEKDLLKIMRKKKKITQYDIAKELGVAQAEVSYLENDQKKFSNGQYEKYKDFIVNYDSPNLGVSN